MRNHSSKYHVPSQEWSKIVKFNSNSYLLKSLFDTETRKPFSFDAAFLTDRSHILCELPWRTTRQLGVRSLAEDFFDDFDDMIAQDIDDEVDNALANDNSYILTDKDGNQHDIAFSQEDDGDIKNAIFFLIHTLLYVDSSVTIESVDELLYMSGKLNNINSYKMDIAQIVYTDATMYLKPAAAGTTGKGYLQIYFTSDEKAMFKLFYPELISRNRTTPMIVEMNYDMFCDILPADRITLARKEPAERFKTFCAKTLRMLIERGGSISLMDRTEHGINFAIFNRGRQPETPAVIKENFRVVEKYSQKAMGNEVTFLDSVDDDMPEVSRIFDGGDYQPSGDEQHYLLIGGSEYLIANMMNSVWLGTETTAVDYAHIRFFTPDPEIRTKKIEHNALLVPLTSFVQGIIGLYLFAL